MVYGAIVAKVCLTSHGQPFSGLRRRAMMSARGVMSGCAIGALLGNGQVAEPVETGIAHGEEFRIHQVVARVVAHAFTSKVDHAATGLLEHALAGCGIPFAG